MTRRVDSMARGLWIFLGMLLIGTPAVAVTKVQVNTDSPQTLSNKTFDATNTLNAPTLSGTVVGTYTLGGTPTIASPILSGTTTGTYTLAGTPTITSPTISGPTLSGTVGGIYTLGGTPTLSGTVAGTPTFSGALTMTNTVTLNQGTTAELVVTNGTTPALTVDTTNTKLLTGTVSGTHCEVQTTLIGCGTGASIDTTLVRTAASTWQLGPSAASPTAQLLKGAGARGGTDSNVAGATLSLGAGQGTGTGVGGTLNLQVAYPGTTGTAANALTTILSLLGANAQSSGTASANCLICLTPTVNQSGTAGYTGLLLNTTETATGSGTKNLLDLQVGSASKFAVSDTGVVTASGAISGAPVTDLVQTYSALTFCHADNTQIVQVRVAANNWALARNATGAETYNFVCDLPAPTRTTSGKGYQLTAVALVQQITGAALTSNTFNALSTVTYSNNVANAVAGYGGAITITMPTATQTNPYVTTGTIGTPAFMNTAQAAVNLDFTVVMQNSGTYRLYGVIATWTRQD